MVCAVHCLLVGVALSVLSVLGLGFLGSRPAELVFFGLAITIGAFAIYAGYQHHRSFKPGLLYLAGIGLVAVSHFVIGRHDHAAAQENLLTTILSVAGGLSLVSFHIVNTKMSRACHGACHCPHHEGRQ